MSGRPDVGIGGMAVSRRDGDDARRRPASVPTGFTTGYLAHGSGGLQIDLDVTDAQVRALNTEGAAAAFPLRECLSVSDCYDRFVDLLENVGHPCPIYPVPQEMFTDEPFYHLDEPLAFDDLRAQAYFDQCLFARDALLEFSAPWRGKKTPPSLLGHLRHDLRAVLGGTLPLRFRSLPGGTRGAGRTAGRIRVLARR